MSERDHGRRVGKAEVAAQMKKRIKWLEEGAREVGIDSDAPSGRRCVWVQEQDYPVYYAGCKENEEFHLAPGMDLYPYCHWCGGLIEIGSAVQGET